MNMTEKLSSNRHIRQQLETLYQQKYSNKPLKKSKKQMYKGLGLNWRSAVVLVFFLFYFGLYQVQAQEYLDLEDVESGMLLSYHKVDNDYAALDLVHAQYSVNITGIYAEVTITQTFQNNSSQWIEEGLYAFPMAENAAVFDMKLKIGKRIIVGEIHEKQKAQQIYDKAKSEGITASLVKQHRPNLFTTDVANIMPNEVVDIEISYQQTLLYDAGHIDFRLPLAIKERYMPSDSDESPLNRLVSVSDNNYRTININLEAGFELSDIKSLYHNVNINQNGYSHMVSLTDSVLIDENDFVLRWNPLQGNEPKAAMFSEKLAGEEYILMMILPPNNKQVVLQKREVVFIIDTSGSMHGQAMNAAKDALLFGLTQLGEEDKFNIIEFNSNARELFKQSVSANPNYLDDAIEFIDSLKSDGGTNMLPALSLAMEDKIDAEYLKQIIFITDGSVGNEAQIFSQIAQQIDQARLFTIAIGAAPNNYFMTKAALLGKGSYTNIANLTDVDESMNALFLKLSSPALTDIAIDWNSDSEQSPAIIPDLYSDQPIVVTAKVKDFNSDISIGGSSNTVNWYRSFAFNQDGRSKGISKLWARNKLDEMTDDYMLGSDIDFDLLKSQITELALKYHLVSEFTSLVAVDKTPNISRLVAIQARDLNPNNGVVYANFSQTALGWKLQLIIGFILLLSAMLSHRSIKNEA
jgi:Ca-activated chloride channel family protein